MLAQLPNEYLKTIVCFSCVDFRVAINISLESSSRLNEPHVGYMHTYIHRSALIFVASNTDRKYALTTSEKFRFLWSIFGQVNYSRGKLMKWQWGTTRNLLVLS